MKLPRFKIRSIPYLFAFITFIAYGLLLRQTGFYWDDWPFAWTANFLGPAEFFPAFIFIRPFLIPIFFVTTSLVPPVPIYWQIFALIIRFIAGLAALFTLNRVWPHFKYQMLVAALLFLVFPAYSQHWVAYTHINQEWIAFILYLLSMGLTASALRDPQKFKTRTIYAVVLLFEGLFATEYFLGMEPLRFLFIWVIMAEDTKGFKYRFIKAFRIWLPYLCVWLLNGIWLAWYYSQGYNAYDLDIIKEPLSIIDLFYMLSNAIWQAGLYAWVQVLALTANSITSPSTVLTYLLISLTFLFLLPILKKVIGTSITSKSTYIQFILIGLLGIILGRVPSLAAGLPFKPQSSFDRFAISMMLGGCLFIVGLVEGLVKSPSAKAYIFAFLIALGVGQQFFNANIFRRDWEKQQEILWELKWRVPGLQPDTVLITDTLPLDYETDISITPAINWMYASASTQFKLPYAIIFSEIRLGGSLSAFEKNIPIYVGLRRASFHGSTSQAVVIYMPTNGCLRVLDPALGDQYTYVSLSPNLVDAIPLSDPSLIHVDADIKMGIPFIPEPEHQWCYYYTKAELARQKRDWQEVLHLMDQAKALGHQPTDPFEWLPYIEAQALTGNLNNAEKLSIETLKAERKLRPGLCQVWKRVQTQVPVGSEPESHVQDILFQFACDK